MSDMVYTPCEHGKGRGPHMVQGAKLGWCEGGRLLGTVAEIEAWKRVWNSFSCMEAEARLSGGADVIVACDAKARLSGGHCLLWKTN